ncbi:MAPEG family protein [Marinobacterium rhizophilum]|uniref:MAPEG family protein n=1 Tax=Marinobacterium rhizophilum TaxID=420402 RepID=A0ABY5HEK0_9GAMM|nr:MAPEG family protein [Marinobacterium rhizophilum]UTW10271.1 MAPEG family protein [Marinobacterium rhizophilum]
MPVILYVLFILCVVPVVLAGVENYYRVRQFERFDNHNPRQQKARLEGVGARVSAAQANAWEALMIFSATCFIAYAGGADLNALGLAALLFLGCRIAHALCYIADLAGLRSLAFGGAMLCSFYIVFQAAATA